MKYKKEPKDETETWAPIIFLEKQAYGLLFFFCIDKAVKLDWMFAHDPWGAPRRPKCERLKNNSKPF